MKTILTIALKMFPAIILALSLSACATVPLAPVSINIQSTPKDAFKRIVIYDHDKGEFLPVIRQSQAADAVTFYPTSSILTYYLEVSKPGYDVWRQTCSQFIANQNIDVQLLPTVEHTKEEADKQWTAELDSEKQRRQKFVNQHPELSDQMVKSIMKGDVAVGMTREMVEASWGKPMTKSYDSGVGGTIETWTFRPYDLDRYNYVYFYEGKLARWSING